MLVPKCCSLSEEPHKNFMSYQNQIISFKLMTCISSFQFRMKQNWTSISYIEASFRHTLLTSWRHLKTVSSHNLHIGSVQLQGWHYIRWVMIPKQWYLYRHNIQIDSSDSDTLKSSMSVPSWLHSYPFSTEDFIPGVCPIDSMPSLPCYRKIQGHFDS